MNKITVTGLVATSPRHTVTTDGLAITSFRLAVARLDAFNHYTTNWYTVTVFKQLAVNAANSISKGDRIVVTGDLIIRDWDNGERAGTAVEIEATALGHDLAYGSSVFTKTVLVETNA